MASCSDQDIFDQFARENGLTTDTVETLRINGYTSLMGLLSLSKSDMGLMNLSPDQVNMLTEWQQNTTAADAHSWYTFFQSPNDDEDADCRTGQTDPECEGSTLLYQNLDDSSSNSSMELYPNNDPDADLDSCEQSSDDSSSSNLCSITDDDGLLGESTSSECSDDKLLAESTSDDSELDEPENTNLNDDNLVTRGLSDCQILSEHGAYVNCSASRRNVDHPGVACLPHGSTKTRSESNNTDSCSAVVGGDDPGGPRVPSSQPWVAFGPDREGNTDRYLNIVSTQKIPNSKAVESFTTFKSGDFSNLDEPNQGVPCGTQLRPFPNDDSEWGEFCQCDTESTSLRVTANDTASEASPDKIFNQDVDIQDVDIDSRILSDDRSKREALNDTDASEPDWLASSNTPGSHISHINNDTYTNNHTASHTSCTDEMKIEEIEDEPDKESTEISHCRMSDVQSDKSAGGVGVPATREAWSTRTPQVQEGSALNDTSDNIAQSNEAIADVHQQQMLLMADNVGLSGQTITILRAQGYQTLESLATLRKEQMQQIGLLPGQIVTMQIWQEKQKQQLNIQRRTQQLNNLILDYDSVDDPDFNEAITIMKSSGLVVNEWKNILRHLGMAEKVIQQLHDMFREPHDSLIRGLKTWWTNDCRATLGTLAAALSDNGCERAAGEIAELSRHEITREDRLSDYNVREQDIVQCPEEFSSRIMDVD